MNTELEEKKPKIEIKELEAEKLRLEIKELDKSWFKKPGFLQVLLPSLIALGSVLYAFQSDLISIQREKNELKEMKLENSIVKFEARKNSLIDTLKLLKSAKDSLKDRIEFTQEYYQEEIMFKAYEGADLIEKIENKKNRIKRLESDVKNLEFNLKIIKNAPFLSQSTKNSLKDWEKKNMEEHMDSLIRTKLGNALESKEDIIKKERKDSLINEYLSLKPKIN